ncbi:unnamed protein product [Cyclocybe aegerita]|uniref:Heterokaryon incompatibility domain-containing protein n=1 Tax=Cyclocybe aegerita TaxID=1973307 RepID=A0A8S0VSM1_CYCAE|nr:unnamed protein product [Cyclocybe aegerita]
MDPDAKELKPTIQLIQPFLPTQVSPESTSPPDIEHHGSIVRPTLDIPLLKKWLEVCSKHGHITPKWSEPDTPFQILLIDVLQRCLVRAGAEKNYVALSYTWGGDQKIKLLRANLEQWKKPGGMLEYSEFPKTLGDAIALVRAMGESYLWIDALCIVQDDEGPDRDTQLKQMNKVYEFARFTLIAAAGSNADAGLPGHSLTVPLPPLLDAIAITQWRTRGWTYQEQLLSPRSLIFTPYQVYYQCDGQVFQEDFRSPSEVDGRARRNSWYSNERLSTPMERILCTDPRTLELSTQEGSPAGLFDRYRSVIGVYTRRDLGRKSDVIAAFSGISAALQCFPASMGYVAGLSVGGLTNALLWTPKQPLTRRRDKIGGKEVNVFPTWSWAGWVGPVSIENVSDLNAPQVSEWWIIYGPKEKEEKVKLPIVDLKTENYYQRQKEGPFSQRRNGAWEVSQAHTLEFRTMVATFHVSVNEGQNTSGFFPIYDAKDQWVGALSVTSVDAQNALQSDEAVLETKALRLFLLVSNRSSSAAIFSDPAVFPSGKEFALNVMMVDRLASGEMERLGHGVIHITARKEACPVKEEVRMI